MGSSLLYISIAYYMQKGGGWVQIACKTAYVLNGRSPVVYTSIHVHIYEGTTIVHFCPPEGFFFQNAPIWPLDIYIMALDP